MRKIRVFTALLFLLFLGSVIHAQELAGIPQAIKSPTQYAEWLATEFEYKIEVPDRWQSPQETIDKRRGDCEDFAVLNSSVLANKFNLKNDLIIVEFKGLDVAHIICVWKNPDGRYSFMSNNKIFHTKYEYIDDAIKHFYPDCARYTLANKMKTAYRYFYRNR